MNIDGHECIYLSWKVVIACYGGFSFAIVLGFVCESWRELGKRSAKPWSTLARTY